MMKVKKKSKKKSVRLDAKFWKEYAERETKRAEASVDHGMRLSIDLDQVRAERESAIYTAHLLNQQLDEAKKAISALQDQVELVTRHRDDLIVTHGEQNRRRAQLIQENVDLARVAAVLATYHLKGKSALEGFVEFYTLAKEMGYDPESLKGVLEPAFKVASKELLKRTFAVKIEPQSASSEVIEGLKKDLGAVLLHLGWAPPSWPIK